MNLQQTIADLEKQATQYSEAANALRALLDGATAQDEALDQKAPPLRRGRRAKGNTETEASKNGSKTSKRRALSAETRAKMSAAMKERHRQKKEQQEG